MTWARYVFQISRTYLHVMRDGEELAARRRSKHSDDAVYAWLRNRGYGTPDCTQEVDESTAAALVRLLPLRPRP